MHRKLKAAMVAPAAEGGHADSLSPLLPLSRGATLLRAFGFPLRFTNPEATECALKKFFPIVFLLSFLILFLLSIIEHTFVPMDYEARHNVTVPEILHWDGNQNPWDTGALYSMYFLSILSPAIYLLLFYRGMASDLTSYLTDYNETVQSLVTPAEIKEAYKKSKLEILFWFAIVLVAGIVLGLVAALPLGFHDSSASAVAYISLLFLLQILHCQEIALDRYAKRVTTLKTAFTGGISEAAEVGVGLSHLTDRLNGVCGCYIVWEYATNLLTITVSVFFGSNMAKLQTADNFELPLCLMSLAHILQAFYGTAKLMSLQGLGQTMSDHYGTIRKTLIKQKLADYKQLSDVEVVSMDTLVDCFSKPSPMRPLDMFNLNRASTASIAGVILTYMIVLLQMKLAAGGN